MNTSQRPSGLDHPIVPKIMRALSRVNVWLYRHTGGRVGGTWRVGSAFPRGVPVLLLTTTGRKSGEPRTTPLIFLEDDARFVVVASQGGLPENPLWYSNLQADPKVQVQVGSKTLSMRARVASPDERIALWPRLVALYADFATYQAWTDRIIPVIVLEP